MADFLQSPAGIGLVIYGLTQIMGFAVNLVIHHYGLTDTPLGRGLAAQFPTTPKRLP